MAEFLRWTEDLELTVCSFSLEISFPCSFWTPSCHVHEVQFFLHGTFEISRYATSQIVPHFYGQFERRFSAQSFEKDV